jgi:hypothetical protein
MNGGKAGLSGGGCSRNPLFAFAGFGFETQPNGERRSKMIDPLLVWPLFANAVWFLPREP